MTGEIGEEITMELSFHLVVRKCKYKLTLWITDIFLYTDVLRWWQYSSADIPDNQKIIIETPVF